MTADRDRNKVAALGFFEQAFNQHQPEDAVDRYMAEPYVQHNPHAEDGMAGSKIAIRSLVAQFPEMHIEVKRVLAEGDLVALHNHLVLLPGTDGMATVDIFRFNAEGRIVEHWDVIQEVPAAAANRNTMF